MALYIVKFAENEGLAYGVFNEAVVRANKPSQAEQIFRRDNIDQWPDIKVEVTELLPYGKAEIVSGTRVW